MKAVVMAAGRGTRMQPLTDTRPKPLLPVAGRPLVDHVMAACVDHVDGFVVVVGYRSQMITDHLGDSFHGIPVEHVTQAERLGTAHAVEQAAPLLDDRFLVVNGDVLLDPDLVRRLVETVTPETETAETETAETETAETETAETETAETETAETETAETETAETETPRTERAAMAVMPVENPSAYGVISLSGQQVTDVVEKPENPPSNLANLGIYAFPAHALEHVEATEQSERGEYELTETVQRLIDAGSPVTAVEHDGVWLDVGRPWELLDANEHLMTDLQHDIRGTVEDGATLRGDVVVEDGARIRSGAYIEGPVIIQAGADVGPNAYVRGSTVIGPGVRVGNAVEVKNSILMADTACGHLSYVGDSVLGMGVNFGAGTIVANLRHDDENVLMHVKGERIDTGRRKLGVVVGDGGKTGIDTSINAGVKLGANSSTHPGKTITRDTDSEV